MSKETMIMKLQEELRALLALVVKTDEQLAHIDQITEDLSLL